MLEKELDALLQIKKSSPNDKNGSENSQITQNDPLLSTGNVHKLSPN